MNVSGGVEIGKALSYGDRVHQMEFVQIFMDEFVVRARVLAGRSEPAVL